MRAQAAAPDDMRTQAAAYADSEFRRTKDDLFSEHRRQEQRQRTIFICYRRGEDAGLAGRLFDQLERTFRRKALFMVSATASA